ncbi:MAG TPA: N-6 DNA methylase, partial [Bacteroidota bacterium]|nr:N-6 DNA methylase [Bacteroidota bacterium]
QEETPNPNPQSPTHRPLTIEEADKITVLDPACGSGSFLLNAYQYLLDWYLLQYSKNPEKYSKGKNPKIYQIIHKKSISNPQPQTPIYKLTIQEKKRILTDHIYGVDIDPQAVEVTKLSLMLKVLEGETEETLNKVININFERALPDLSNNIKCGNSLIGSDFYTGKTMSAYTEDELFKVNAFDWEKEFPQVLGIRDRGQGNAGFDVVIGNPPYGAELNQEERNYLEKKFKLQNTDTACLFMGLATNLLKNNGYNGFIVPKPFLYASNWIKIREKLLENIQQIVDCSKVWKEVKLEQIIYIQQKNHSTDSYESYIRNGKKINYLSNIKKESCKKFGFYLNGITTQELAIGEKMHDAGAFLNDFVINQIGGSLQNYLTNYISDYKAIGGKQINRYFILSSIKGYINKI